MWHVFFDLHLFFYDHLHLFFYDHPATVDTQKLAPSSSNQAQTTPPQGELPLWCLALAHQAFTREPPSLSATQRHPADIFWPCFQAGLFSRVVHPASKLQRHHIPQPHLIPTNAYHVVCWEHREARRGGQTRGSSPFPFGCACGCGSCLACDAPLRRQSYKRMRDRVQQSPRVS